ncbi:MAG: (2Fe-2S)-binding protein [Desulfobacterales bacterium]|nr:(2Fe-2S)-binding protein [Desulfobacterales bacterium]
MLSLKVNGAAYKLKIDPQTPLLWVLREQLGLIGTKYSCGIGECGSCAVHVDGEPELSCALPVGEVEKSEITTIEGFKGKIATALRQAWIAEDVPQCGYCQPGQIMTAAALLFQTPNPTDADINAAMSGVLCRCGTYQAIRRAIQRAAREI